MNRHTIVGFSFDGGHTDTIVWRSVKVSSSMYTEMRVKDEFGRVGEDALCSGSTTTINPPWSVYASYALFGLCACCRATASMRAPRETIPVTKDIRELGRAEQRRVCSMCE